MDDVEARRFFSTLPEATPGPGEDSRERERLSLSGDLGWTAKLLVDERPGDPDRDNGRVKVTSDLLRLRPPTRRVS